MNCRRVVAWVGMIVLVVVASIPGAAARGEPKTPATIVPLNRDVPRHKAINENIKRLADGKMVHYLNINNKLLKSDGTQDRELMPDLVHLTAKGYEIWEDAIESKVAELLKSE